MSGERRGEAGPHGLAVGERFPGAHFPCPDASEYLYHNAGHELRIFWSRPSAREVASVREGRPEFSLLSEEGLVCLAYRFGGEPASQALYHCPLIFQERCQEAPPETGPEGRALLVVVLAYATTGVVRAIGGLTLSPAFTGGLHAAIGEQARKGPITPARYAERVRRIQRRYPSSEAPMEAAPHKTVGDY